MKIVREILGQKIEITLTPGEVLDAYAEKKRDYLTETVVATYDAMHGVLPSAEILDHIITELDDYIETAWAEGMPINNHLTELCTDNPPKKNHYIMHYSMLYNATIEVDAADEQAAQTISDAQLDSAEWVPVDGSEELDNIYNEWKENAK